MNKIKFKILEKFFIFIIIILFFLYNLSIIDYGLPFFLNLDENSFQYSSLSYLSFFTGYFNIIDPIYAPLINIILILKLIFINEFIINSLSLELIKWKIYFNPDLFIFYGRIASLITASVSIYILYLIFNKLKIKFIIFCPLLLSFSTSLVLFDIASINGKHSYYLLLFLIQLYFFFKYLIKIRSFNFKSYIIFGFLGSLAWGVSYWPAFISLYAVFVLHYKKFKLTRFNYLITFLIIFILFGPILGIIFSNSPILSFIFNSEQIKEFDINTFYITTYKDLIEGLKIIFYAEKNLLLLFLFLPFFLRNKEIDFKNEFFLILIIFFEPIILFAISQKAFPQLRYFAGNVCIILILTSLIFNQLYKTKLKILCAILIISNCFFIFSNVSKQNKIYSLISKKHYFYNFNEDIKVDKTKILYLVDLGFQENLKQNNLYLELFENNLITKSENYEETILRINNKINNLKNKSDTLVNNNNIKKDITYFNYTHFKINDLNSFFNYIQQDFDYVLIEETKPFYLSNFYQYTRIKKFVKQNYLVHKINSSNDKVFFRSLRSIIHYYSSAINRFDKTDNMGDETKEKVFGTNYALYSLIK